jgi:thiamine-monophosphate kinase
MKICMSKVSDVGERGLIERMMVKLTQMPDMPLPFWDDASALDMGDGRALVINTDMLVWETDIPAGMTPYQAARKSVVINVSDLGAKGVKPLAFMPNIGLPRDYPLNNAEEIARGFEEGAREYDSYVVGGDTNEACDVIISGVALGLAPKKRLMKRDNGTRPGDFIATTGNFGLTSAGFKNLLEGYNLPEELSKPILDSIYLPEAYVEEGLALSKTGLITGCIDSSDGLAVSLHDLRRSTGYGYKLNSLPLDPIAKRFAQLNDLDPASLALYGGEEYNLVFTFQPKHTEQVQKALNSVGSELKIIGKVTESRDILYVTEDKEVPILPRGWEHFK